MPEETKANGLEKALKGFVDAVDDLATLEVITLTGDIKSIIKDKKTLDWDELLGKAIDAEGEVKLVAATRVSPDYDVLNYRAEAASDSLIKLHTETLQASREGREAIVKIFIDTVTGFLKPAG